MKAYKYPLEESLVIPNAATNAKIAQEPLHEFIHTSDNRPQVILLMLGQWLSYSQEVEVVHLRRLQALGPDGTG